MRRSSLFAVLLLLLALPAAAAEPSWQAGFAKVKITPSTPMWMSGYASRKAPAEGTESDLFARAMVLRDADGRTAVLVSLDLVGIDRNLSKAMADSIQTRHKVLREGIAFATSHTHSGPVLGSTLRSMYFFSPEEAQKVADYTAALPKLVDRAVDEAFANLAPVTLSWAQGTAGFAVNRRENVEKDVPAIREKGELKGPIDHAVPVLAARDAKGKLVGLVFGYACHATVLSDQKWCADYPGYAATGLEAEHAGAVALFVAGCGADQNPIPRRSVALAKTYGQQLSAAVNEVLAAPMRALKPHWRGTYATIDLPLHAIPTRDALVADSMNADKYIAARAKMLLKQLETEGSIPKTYPYPIQTWRLDDLAMVLLGGEVVVDYSLRIKKELPGKTWPIAYANDVMAYIPSLRVLKEGGYEGATSMVYYGLPSVWGEAVEELIVAEVVRQGK